MGIKNESGELLVDIYSWIRQNHFHSSGHCILIIVFSFVIYRQVERGRTLKDEKLTSKEDEDSMAGTQPKGISFHASCQRKEGLATFE